MKTLDVEIKHQLAKLARAFKREGAADELAAARELARDDLPVNQIYFMMRGVISKAAIVLLRTEARAKRK